jgi:hypothetical protein
MDFPSQEVTTIAAILVAVCALAIAVVGRAALDPYTRAWDQDVEPSSRWFLLTSAPHPMAPLQIGSRADACNVRAND